MEITHTGYRLLSVEPRFVGRSAELRELLGLLDAALDGRPGLALLIGEPGIGKTRLAAELGRMAGVRAVPVLWGRCTDAEGVPAYWPWRSVLRSWLAGAGPEDVAPQLRGPAARLVRIAPELPVAEHAGRDGRGRRRSGPGPGGPPEPTPEERFGLFDAMAGLLAAVARPVGLVVVLDDAHWADPASAALLLHLAREARDARLLLVVTGRTAELAGGPLVGDLSRAPGAAVLELSGLAEADVAAALAERLGAVPDPDVVARVSARTAGNPFLVGEAARALRGAPVGAGVPAAVRDAVRRRLDRLPAGCRALLRPAAVLGRDVDAGLLATVSGVSADAVLAGLAPAVADGVLEAGVGTASRFAHDLVRETVLAGLDQAERARVHAAAAAALEPAAADPDVVVELAEHALAALPLGDPDRARTWARRSDDPAALVAALRARQLARAGPDGNAERLRLGGRMIELGRRTGAADTVMWGHLWRFDALLQAGRTTEAEAELGPLEEATARSGEPLGRWHLLRSRIAVSFTRGRFAEAHVLNTESWAIAHRGGHEAAEMTARAAACHLATLLGREDVLTDGLESVIAVRTPYAQLVKLSMALWHLELGRPGEAARWCDGLPPADAPGIPAFMLLITAALRARVAAAFEDAPVAAAVHRVLAPHAGLHVVGGAGAMASHGPVRLYLGLTALTCGRTATAIEYLRAAVGESEEAAAAPWTAYSRLCLARALRARGRPGDAAEASAAASAAADAAA